MRKFKSTVTLALLALCFLLKTPEANALQKARYASTAHTREWGLGVIFGDPTGLTAKYWKDQRQAYDFGLAYALDNYLRLYADYLYHFPGALSRANTKFTNELVPYVGIGGALFFSTINATANRNGFRNGGNSFGIGARIPLGLEWLPVGTPIGVFIELVPGLALIPSTFGFFDGGIGIRYYF